MNNSDTKKIENVDLSEESTRRKMSAVHLTVLRRTNSQILGVSFDTSLYTRLKFIPRSYEKYVQFKQNALENFQKFGRRISRLELPRQYRDKAHISKLKTFLISTKVLPIEYFVVFNKVEKTARPYFIQSTEYCKVSAVQVWVGPRRAAIICK